MPLSIINIILLGTCLYLFINWYKLRDYTLELILFVVITEFTAEVSVYLLNKFEFTNGSSWVYNFSLPIECFLYGLMFRNIFSYKWLRNLISIASILVLFPFVIHYFSPGSFFSFNSILYGYVCLFLLVCSLSFFIVLALKDYFYINPLKQFYFWISSGLLVCYLGGFMLLTNSFSLFQKNKLLYLDLKQLNLILNIFLCLCIIIATECLKKYKVFQIRLL